jgi:hypothetical protein
MGARAESGPDAIVRAVGGEPWISGCHKPGTGIAGGIRGARGASGALRSSKTYFFLFSCGIIVLFVVVAAAFPADGIINDNGGESKGLISKFGTGIENCSLIALILAFWASI